MSTIDELLAEEDCRVGIVVGLFNGAISKTLLEGALDCLKGHSCPKDTGTIDVDIEWTPGKSVPLLQSGRAGTIDVDIAWVPGAFEIPLMAQKMAQTKKYDSLICLGAVIRGETPHFDYISSQVSGGISRVMLDTGIPIIFGVLTTNTVDEAIKRSDLKKGNKGWDAAFAAIEMVALLRNLKVLFNTYRVYIYFNRNFAG